MIRLPLEKPELRARRSSAKTRWFEFAAFFLRGHCWRAAFAVSPCMSSALAASVAFSGELHAIRTWVRPVSSYTSAWSIRLTYGRHGWCCRAAYPKSLLCELPLDSSSASRSKGTLSVPAGGDVLTPSRGQLGVVRAVDLNRPGLIHALCTQC